MSYFSVNLIFKKNEIKLKLKKNSNNQINLEIWNSKGNVLPLCINSGCDNNVAIRHWSDAGNPSLRSECNSCISAKKKNKKKENVIYYKKNYCENHNGILGFQCPMDSSRYSEFPSDIYHMDHVDGNHFNNDQKNVKTFCAICHTRKGKENNDFNSQKLSSMLHNKLKI